MKLKLTAAEFHALYAFFEHMIKDARPDGMNAKMLHSILMEIYEKMYRKAFKKKSSYSVLLKDFEAVGFYMFFSKYSIDPEMVFEANLIRTINNSIHQKLS
jgi:hypothetical protein